MIAQLGWDDLRLSLDETRLMATARQPIEAEFLQTLYEQSDGWAAGVVLMLERFKQTGTVSRGGSWESLETVFDYFAGEIFQGLDAGTREFLIRTCMLSRVTVELAMVLTERLDAAEMLAKLHQGQLFIDRRLGETVTYQYHALFSRFLQSQAQASLTEEAYRALVARTAEALVSQNQIEDAIPLFVAARAWKPAIGLIVTQAQGLLAMGRWQTVQQWIESLPQPVRNATLWLAFWLGMCRLRVDPAQARLDLEPAFAAFQGANDVLGQALAATAILEAHMAEWMDYRRLDPWIESLEALLNDRDTVFPSLNTELAVRAGLFTAIVLRQTYREDIPQLARELGEMLHHDLDPNYKLLAARGLFVYGAYTGDFVFIDQVANRTRSAFDASAASALNRAWYATRLGYALRWVEGAREKARAWFAKAREIVREHELRFVEVPVAIYWAWSEEIFGETEDIERELEIAEAYLNPASRIETALRQMGLSFLCARHNDLRAAAAHMRETLSFMEQSGYTLGQLAVYVGLAGNHLSNNDFNGAQEALDQALKRFFPCPLRSYIDAMFHSGIALGMDNQEHAQALLGRALALGAKYGLENTLSERCLNRNMAAFCAYALKHDIETDYVKLIIRVQRLSAPSPDIAEWPRPVRISLLGHFMIEVDDKPLSFAGKGPQKPLELLKALAAADVSSVDIGWLGEQLWPDADAARDTLNVTLARLRKLLPIDDVLVLNEGKLSLNADLVWTDVAAFERLADQCSNTLRRNPPSDEVENFSERLLSLYGGELLKGERSAPWLIAARDRLRSKFLRTLKVLAAYWEERGEWDQAQNLYERALEIDNVAEEIYRRLMQCYVQAGQPAEAQRVYQRCRDMLSLVLGIAPSAETETLLQTILPPQT